MQQVGAGRVADPAAAVARAGGRAGAAGLPRRPDLRSHHAADAVLELAYQRQQLDPGEEVSVVDRTEHAQVAQLDRDWWALDFETADPSVLLLDYAPDGTYLGRRHMTDPAVVAQCRAELDLAQRLAVPIEDYLRATR